MDPRERYLMIGAGVVSTIVTLGFCFAYAASMFLESKPDPDLKGALTLAFGSVIGFWTGPLLTRKGNPS